MFRKWIIQQFLDKLSTFHHIDLSENYTEGIRRLQRSYDTSNVESTSAAEDSNHEPSNKDQEYPQVLDQNEKNAALKQAPVIKETITGIDLKCEHTVHNECFFPSRIR